MDVGPTSARMASSDMGAWVPNATTALQVLVRPATPFLNGPEEERQGTIPGPVGDHDAERAAGQVQSGHLLAHERAHLLRVQHVPGSPDGGRHRAASSSESPSFVSRSSMWATSSANTLAPSATRLSSRRPSGRTAAARSRAASGSARAGRRTPGTSTPPAPASQIAVDEGEARGSERCGLAGGDDGEQSLGQLGRPVGPDLRARMGERRVGESPQRVVGERRRPQCSGKGRHLQRVLDDVPCEAGDEGIRHRTGDRGVARQHAAVGHGRMRTVQEPELATLERGDVIHQLDAGIGQVLQPVHRTDDPRPVLLGRDGRLVPQAEPFGDLVHDSFGHRGHHAVDDGTREAHVAGDPRRQLPVDPLGFAEDALSQDGPVVEQVVERREDWYRQSGLSPSVQRQRDQRRHRRRQGTGRLLSLGAAAVPVLRDGQRHEPDGRCGQGGHRRSRPASRRRQRANHLELRRGARLADRDREESVLGLELVLDAPASERDAPHQCRRALSKELVGVDGDVGPGERADADVGDGRCALSVVVRQTGMRARQRQRAQPWARFAHQDPPRSEQAGG